MIRRVPGPDKDPRNKERQVISYLGHVDPLGLLTTGETYRMKHHRPLVIAAALKEWADTKEAEEARARDEEPPAAPAVGAEDGGALCW